jgi:hypothetical protein
MGLTYVQGKVTGPGGRRATLKLLVDSGATPVILGEPGDEALLGAITLEILGFVLNPFNRSLQPMRIMLA